MRKKNIVVAKTMYVCDRKKICAKSGNCGICTHTSDPKHALYSDHPDSSFTHMIDPKTRKVSIWEEIRDEDKDWKDHSNNKE